MDSQEFSPRASLERAFQRWWVIILLTALGGIAGWALHFTRPPVYEATAVITANMNFQKVKLTLHEEDYAFNAAGAIGTSTDVMDQIIVASQAGGFPIDMNQLSDQMTMERKQSVWELHIRNRDPQTAAKLANLWAENTVNSLDAALGHAVLADQIQAQIDTLTGSQSSSGAPGLSPENQTALQNLTDKLAQEQKLSRGVISIMKFTLSESARIPQKPALYNLADLVLAGASIGFIISLWVANGNQGQRRG
jgi:uncharacterized protein involved in exopolysaccharide biosynthesis